MTKLNVTQAAKALGMSKTTLYKHVDEGRVSCGLDDKSKTTFDPAELARVYPDRFNVEHFQTFSSRPEDSSQTAQNVHLVQEKDKRIKELEDQVKDLKDDKQERKTREAKLLEIVEKQTLMLSAPERNKTVWSRLKAFFAEA